MSVSQGGQHHGDSHIPQESLVYGAFLEPDGHLWRSHRRLCAPGLARTGAAVGGFAFNTFGKVGRQRPWTRLPQNVQCAAFIEHIKAGSISLPVEMNTDDGFADVEVAHSDLGKPIWQFRIQQQRLHGSKRINPKHCLHDGGQTRG